MTVASKPGALASARYFGVGGGDSLFSAGTKGVVALFAARRLPSGRITWLPEIDCTFPAQDFLDQIGSFFTV
jgi:hypothetical protein